MLGRSGPKPIQRNASFEDRRGCGYLSKLEVDGRLDGND